VNTNSNVNSPANGNSSQTLSGRVGGKIKQIIVDELGVDDNLIKPGARLVNDLGADSLDSVELVMRLEEEFGIEIPDEDCAKLKTVGDMSRYVSNKLRQQPGGRSRGGNTNSGGDSNANSNDGGAPGGNANTGETPTRNVNSGAPIQIAYSRAAAGGVTIVRFDGKLVGAAASGRLKSYINTLIGKKEFKVVLDLGGVTDMDDKNLQQIVSQESALKRRGGRLVLRNVSKKLRNLLKITQMITVFDTYEDEDEAVKSFQP
jgi:acyl carrier protein